MKILEVEGNVPLLGSVPISGAKNSAVALIPAAILSNNKSKFSCIYDVNIKYNANKMNNEDKKTFITGHDSVAHRSKSYCR